MFVAAAAPWLFRGDPHLRRSVASTVLGMLVGGLVAVVPTMLVARAFGYASATPVVLLELAMVLAFLVAGIVIARVDRAATRAYH